MGVARAVFAERGYEAASVEEIADRAGVSKPVLYDHFGGKENLYAVVADREVQHLTDRITDSLLGADHPRAAAEQAAEAFLAYIDEHADGFRILVRDPPVGSGHFASVITEVAAAAEDLLAAEFAGRGLDPRTAPMYARMLVGAVAQVGEWWLAVRTHEDGLDRPVVAAHIVNLLWLGLRGLEAAPVLHGGGPRGV